MRQNRVKRTINTTKASQTKKFGTNQKPWLSKEKPTKKKRIKVKDRKNFFKKQQGDKNV